MNGLRPRARVLLLTVLPLVAACGGNGPGSLDDGNPLSRVEHELSGAPELELELLGVLGLDGGLVAGGFRLVGNVFLGPDLEILVHNRPRTIVRIEPDLDSVSVFPGRGEGPGEAEVISSFGVVGDSLLLVGELTAGRVQYFTLHGTLVEIVTGWTSRRFQHDRAPDVRVWSETPSIVLPDGSGISLPRVSYSLESLEAGGLRSPKLAVRHRPGEAVDPKVIAEAWTDRPGLAVRLYRGIPVRVFHPLEPSALLALMPDASGVVTSEVRGASPSGGAGDQEVEVILRSVDGDTLFRRVLCAPQPRLQGWRLDEAIGNTMPSFENRAEAHMAEPPTAADVQAALRSAGFLESLRGPVLGLAGTQDGGIWVALDGGSGDEMPWILLDRSGRTVAWVRLPRSERIQATREDRLVTVNADPLGIETVRVYRAPDLPSPESIWGSTASDPTVAITNGCST